MGAFALKHTHPYYYLLIYLLVINSIYGLRNLRGRNKELIIQSNKYQPELNGFRWTDEDGLRFQLEPQGYQGYIEGRPVRPLR
jgi:hypothetical protein